MAFHSDTYKPNLSIFKHTNMTDIYVSIDLQKHKIPMLNLKRPQRWIGISTKHNDDLSIHNFCNKEDVLQTALINTVAWKINTVNI